MAVLVTHWGSLIISLGLTADSSRSDPALVFYMVFTWRGASSGYLHGLSVVSVQDCKGKSPTVIAVQQFAFSYSVHRRMPKCMYLDVPCVYVLKVFARKDTMRLWVVDFYKLLNRLCLDYSLYRLLAIFCGFNSVRHRLVVLV